MKELTLTAVLENLEQVQAFVRQELKTNGCPLKIQMQAEIAVEEIYVNIAYYAYNPKKGQVTIRCDMDQACHQFMIQFIDEGVPFDPLAKADADITLPAEERQIGGLGILMVKKSMDSMKYEYQDGKNILTLLKNTESGK